MCRCNNKKGDNIPEAFKTDFSRQFEKLPCCGKKKNKKNKSGLYFDSDTILLSYYFDCGSDLDIRMNVIEPHTGTTIGWSKASSASYKGTEFIKWGGDNTGQGKEQIKIDVKKLKELNPDFDEVKIEMRAFWYGSACDKPVFVDAKHYKGGTPRKQGYHWEMDNPDNEKVIRSEKGNVVRHRNEIGQEKGDFVAVYHYDLKTGRIWFEMEEKKEPITDGDNTNNNNGNGTTTPTNETVDIIADTFEGYVDRGNSLHLSRAVNTPVVGTLYYNKNCNREGGQTLEVTLPADGSPADLSQLNNIWEYQCSIRFETEDPRVTNKQIELFWGGTNIRPEDMVDILIFGDYFGYNYGVSLSKETKGEPVEVTVTIDGVSKTGTLPVNGNLDGFTDFWQYQGQIKDVVITSNDPRLHQSRYEFNNFYFEAPIP